MPDSTERLSAALEGRYHILRRVGEGGMAVVYLAEDLRHRRRIALKILRPELAASLGTQRFLREIEIAARLTHPSILPLLDSGDADGTLFYVMPFVEGESLRERLVREGPLPVDEAVKVAQRVAAALGYAHGLGVVHRDIKPENILLSGGEPVVTDFGIAKAVSEAGQTALTETGFAVGTAPYMSPEQSGGERQLDGRSDLYSLGCVLYEMLGGAPPFTGPTLHAITARKLAEPVPPLRTVRDTVPEALEQIVFRSLARLPADRFATGQQMAESLEAFRIAMSTPSAPVPAAAIPAPDAGRGRLRRTLVGAGLVVVAAAAGWFFGGLRGRAADLRLSVVTPPGTELYAWRSPIVLSPDGRTLVFVAGHDDSTRLYARALDAFDARVLPGTEGGDSPFFSPDGRWVGFFDRRGRALRKVALAGGSALPVVQDLSAQASTGVWGPGDTIYFVNWPDQQIRKVAAAGGPVGQVTRGNPPGGWFRFPLAVLPDGRHLLVAVLGSAEMGGRVDAVSLETGEHAPLLSGTTYARPMGDDRVLFLPYGHSELAAVRFDPRALATRGDPVTVLDSVAVGVDGEMAYFDVARNGTFAYLPATRWRDPDAFPELEIVDADGAPVPVTLPRGSGPRFSPDGRRIVHMGPGRNGPDIFVFDLERGVDRAITSHEGRGYEGWPAFSPDGRTVVYNADPEQRGFLVLRAVASDGSGSPRRLATDTVMHQQPFTFAAGGSVLVYTEGPSGETGMDIWTVPMHGGEARPLMASAANESQPAVSPDGRWLAWMTDASGRPEVMVRPYPDGPAIAVSREGGIEPAWAPDGRRIYFRDVGGTEMMAVAFTPGSPPRVGEPVVLFHRQSVPCYVWCRSWDVSPDGRRFLMLKSLEGLTPTGYWQVGREIRIVRHWDREVRARMEAAGR